MASLNKGIQNQRGFSLIEVAISLILLGVLTTVVINVYETHQERKVRLADKERINAIRQAMTEYLVNNGNVPPPAPYDLSQGTNGFGSGLAPAGGAVDIVGGTDIRIGSIPVAELGLTYDYTYDAYLSRYTYYYSPGGNITVNGIPTNFAVVSHGLDSKCAVPTGGQANLNAGTFPTPSTDTTTPADSPNCADIVISSGNAALVDLPYTNRIDNIYNVNHFDDLLLYDLNVRENTLWSTVRNGAMTDVIAKSEGNVGLNTATPSAKLHVGTGNVNITGNVQVNSNIQVNGAVDANGNVTADTVRAERFIIQ